MQLIVCLDDRDGMCFAGRRQSIDRLVREQMLKQAGKSKLWMNAYSSRQFESLQDNILVDENYLNKAGEEDYCFAENDAFVDYLGKIRTVIIYRWGRIYPSDVKFPNQILSPEKKISATEFAGYSHDKITEEVYYL